MNPHDGAYETPKVTVPSLRNGRDVARPAGLEPASPGRGPGILGRWTTASLVDSEGIEPSSRGCRPRILPLNDEPILARTTGLEPVLPR